MKDIKLYGTCDASGDLTVLGEQAVKGLLHSIQLIDGDFADGVDITVTCENSGMSIPVYIKANFNTDAMVYPRVLESANTDGAATTNYTFITLAGVPKMVVAQGGNAVAGGCILYYFDD
jgi:hypothetical protein